MRWEAAFAPADAEPAEPPSEAMMEIKAGLRDPQLTHGKFIRLIKDLAAVTVAEGLTGDVALLERRADLLELLVGVAKDFPDDPPPRPPELSPEEQERESAAIMEQLVQRFSAPVEEPPDWATAAAAGAAP